MEQERWLVVADTGGVHEVLEIAQTWDDALKLHLSHSWRNKNPHRRIHILPNPAAVARLLGWKASPYVLARYAEECIRNPALNR